MKSRKLLVTMLMACLMLLSACSQGPTPTVATTDNKTPVPTAESTPTPPEAELEALVAGFQTITVDVLGSLQTGSESLQKTG